MKFHPTLYRVRDSSSMLAIKLNHVSKRGPWLQLVSSLEVLLLQLGVINDAVAMSLNVLSMVSCQKGPTRHTYAWQIGPFWQDTLVIFGTAAIALLL